MAELVGEYGTTFRDSLITRWSLCGSRQSHCIENYLYFNLDKHIKAEVWLDIILFMRNTYGNLQKQKSILISTDFGTELGRQEHALP